MDESGLAPLERAPRPASVRPHRGPRNSPNPPGRAPYVPTEGHRRLVEALRSVGVPVETVASVLKVAVSTVEKHFRAELAAGKATIKAKIGAKVVQKALSGDNFCMAFYLKNHGGEEWRTPTRMEHGNLDGSPLAAPNLVLTVLEPVAQAGDEQPTD